jgi:nucleoside-diphosphate-sugar epimerase
MSKTAFVTGATGFVGRHLIARLRGEGYAVRALARDQDKFNSLFGQDPAIELVHGDLTDEDALRRGLADADLLFHVAGVTKAAVTDEYYRVNQKGTSLVYETVRRHSPELEKIVHVSSLAAVGPAPTADPPADFPEPRPVSHYGRSKLQGEEEARRMMADFPLTIIRPPAVFGPADTDVLMFFKMVSRGILPLIGGNDKLVSLVYVEDLAAALLAAALGPATGGRTYFVCYDEPFRWKELGRLAAELLARDVKCVTFPHWLTRLVGICSEFLHRIIGRPTKLNQDTTREMTQQYWICSNENARKDFNFRPEFPIEEAFARTIAWYQEHGQLPR